MADLRSEQGKHEEELDTIRRRVLHLEERVRQQECDAVILRDTLDKYRQLIEHTLDWVWEVDAEGRYTYVGPQAKRILGYDPSELLGKTPFDLMPDTESTKVAEKFSAAVKARAPLVRIINRNRHRDGHVVTLETSGTPIISENDELIGYRGVDRDVSDRESMAEELRDTAHTLESVLDAIPDAISIRDREYGVLRTNAAGRQMRKQRAQTPDTHVCYSLLGGDRPCENCATKAVYETGKPIQQMRHVPELGCWVDVRGYPILDADGNVARVIEHVRDVTAEKKNEEQRKRLEEQVRHTQQLESLGILAGGIAHDFNNLLMAILGNADLAMEELSQEELRPYLQDIVGASKRAAELCSQMLSYSGRGTFSMKRMDLNDVVDRAAATISLSLASGVTTRIEKGRNIPTVNVDSTQVRQVLMNILTNASDAMNDAEGEVVISTGVVSCTEADLEDVALGQRLSPGPYAYLEVQDKGVGMDDETRARVFDPFYTTKFTGRGLGLAAALGIMQAHHGGIRITSRPGRGTKVRLLFPLAMLPGDYTRQSETTTPEDEGTGKTILLVDDEEALLIVGRKMLEKLGYHVLTADNGLAAVETLKSHNARINCIILDLTMTDSFGSRAHATLEIPQKLSSYGVNLVVNHYG